MTVHLPKQEVFEMNNLLLEVEGPIAVLTINRPKALNALNSETLTELNEVLTEIEGRDDIKVVILTGAGEKSFVAGADISEMVNFSAAELNEYIATIKEGGEVSAKEFPSYLSVFISDYFNTPAESAVLHEDHLAALYYEYAMKCGNKFVSSWFEFNLTINNILIAFSARKYKWDVAQNVVGNTEVCEALRISGARDFGLSGEVDCLEQLMKISEITELVEREKKLDSLRWNWMEEATFFDYFTVERIFAFLLQLEMIERWIALDKEKGNQLFRSIIDALKDEVQIPAEFR